jgi:hypothetical protein
MTKRRITLRFTESTLSFTEKVIKSLKKKVKKILRVSLSLLSEPQCNTFIGI